MKKCLTGGTPLQTHPRWTLGKTAGQHVLHAGQDAAARKLCLWGLDIAVAERERKALSFCRVSPAPSTGNVWFASTGKGNIYHHLDPSPCLGSRSWRVDLELRGNQWITCTWYIIFTCQGKKWKKEKKEVGKKEKEAGPSKCACPVWKGQQKDPGWGYCNFWNATLQGTLDAFKRLHTCLEPAFYFPSSPDASLCSSWPLSQAFVPHL